MQITNQGVSQIEDVQQLGDVVAKFKVCSKVEKKSFVNQLV